MKQQILKHISRTRKDEIDIKDELISELVSRKENKTNADSS